MSNNILIGKFFHSFNEADDVIWQGVIEGQVNDEYFLITTFSWITGGDSLKHVCNLSRMKKWIFYNSSEEMQDYYDRVLIKRQK